MQPDTKWTYCGGWLLIMNSLHYIRTAVYTQNQSVLVLLACSLSHVKYDSQGSIRRYSAINLYRDIYIYICCDIKRLNLKAMHKLVRIYFSSNPSVPHSIFSSLAFRLMHDAKSIFFFPFLALLFSALSQKLMCSHMAVFLPLLWSSHRPSPHWREGNVTDTHIRKPGKQM